MIDHVHPDLARLDDVVEVSERTRDLEERVMTTIAEHEITIGSLRRNFHTPHTGDAISCRLMSIEEDLDAVKTALSELQMTLRTLELTIGFGGTTQHDCDLNLLLT